MFAPARIDPDGIYHDGDARLLLGLTSATMVSARRGGKLRFTRKGRSILYRGQWLLDWLNADTAHSPDSEGVPC